MRHSVLASVGLLMLPSFALASVLVVAPSGAPYATVQAAIDASVDGDTILIKTGNYAGFILDNQSLSIVADVEGTVAINGPIEVRNVALGQRVSLAGMSYPAGGMLCSASVGSIRLEAMKSHVPSTYPAYLPHGLRIDGCADVAVLRCELQGWLSYGPFPSHPGDGLESNNSNVAIYDSTVIGGKGSDAIYIGSGGSSYGPLPGAPGAELLGSTQLLTSGSTITGGQGGQGLSGICYPWIAGGGPGAAGGTGLIVNGSAQTYVLDSAVTGGAGGVGGNGAAGCGTPPGPAGPPGANTSGTVNALAGPRAVLQCATHLREQNSLPLTITGQPGDQAWLRIAATSQWVLTLPLKGVQLAGPMSRRRFLGTVPPSGVLNTSLFFGPLGAGVESRTWHMQAFLIDSAGATRAGSGAVVVVLDSAF